MNKRNFQLELERVLKEVDLENPPSLLLHSCCAPCSSYVLEYLSDYFKITVFYFNPNIYPEEEFHLRMKEQECFIGKFATKNPVSFIGSDYQSERFYEAVKGLEAEKEGGARCDICFNLRLSETAKLACELGYDYFATTLSISPHKNSQKLGEVSDEISKIYSVKNLPCDFKKKGGFFRSTEISKEYNIYRQDYCGCVFSLRERNETK